MLYSDRLQNEYNEDNLINKTLHQTSMTFMYEKKALAYIEIWCEDKFIQTPKSFTPKSTSCSPGTLADTKGELIKYRKHSRTSRGFLFYNHIEQMKWRTSFAENQRVKLKINHNDHAENKCCY